MKTLKVAPATNSRLKGWLVTAGLLAFSTPAQAQQTPNTPGAAFRDCPQCSEMVVIPAGSFLMGSRPDPASKFEPDNDEQPQHPVTLKAFALGKYEVTQEQWFAVMGAYPKLFNRGPNLPVENVSWDDAQDFIHMLNVKTGKKYRLPTEAEWEYAARAGTTTRYSFGDDDSQMDRHAWFAGNSDSKTHPVGQKLPNQFGLYDMHGNVSEWLQDCYANDYVGAPADGSAVQEIRHCERVYRGSSWTGGPGTLRSALRDKDSPDFQHNRVGFRLARTLD